MKCVRVSLVSYVWCKLPRFSGCHLGKAEGLLHISLDAIPEHGMLRPDILAQFQKSTPLLSIVVTFNALLRFSTGARGNHGGIFG